MATKKKHFVKLILITNHDDVNTFFLKLCWGQRIKNNAHNDWATMIRSNYVYLILDNSFLWNNTLHRDWLEPSRSWLAQMHPTQTTNNIYYGLTIKLVTQTTHRKHISNRWIYFFSFIFFSLVVAVAAIYFVTVHLQWIMYSWFLS